MFLKGGLWTALFCLGLLPVMGASAEVTKEVLYLALAPLEEGKLSQVWATHASHQKTERAQSMSIQKVSSVHEGHGRNRLPV